MIKALAAADLHMGRSSTRLGDGIDASATRAWERLVDAAIRERVDLVLLAGDLLNDKDAYWEAAGPIESGLRRLAGQGIHVYATAGNHDWEAFPRLLDALGPAHFHFLGRAGAWERAGFEKNGERLDIAGWSFPASRFQENPLTEPGATAVLEERGVPLVGLLHGDLDGSKSRYAPVASASLAAHRAVDLWILGHIHASNGIPFLREGPVAANARGFKGGYTGSVQALNPGETGRRGAWLVEFEGRAPTLRLLPLSTVFYAETTADLTGVGDAEEGRDRALAALRKFSDGIAQGEPDPGLAQEVPVRLTLTGETSAHRHLPAAIAGARDELRLESSSRSGARLGIRVHEIVCETRPRLDLETLASGRDLLARLAGQLLALERGEAAALADARGLMDDFKREVMERNPLAGAVSGEDFAIGEEEARAILIKAGRNLLAELHARKEAAA